MVCRVRHASLTECILLGYGIAMIGGEPDGGRHLLLADELGEEVRGVLGVAHVADLDGALLHAPQEGEVAAEAVA